MEAEFKKIDVNGGGIILFDEHLGRLSYSILLAFVLPIFPDLVMTYFFPDSTVRHFPMYPSAAAYSVLRSAYGLKMQCLQSLICVSCSRTCVCGLSNHYVPCTLTTRTVLTDKVLQILH